MSVIQATKRAVRAAAIGVALVAFGSAAYGQQPTPGGDGGRQGADRGYRFDGAVSSR